MNKKIVPIALLAVVLAAWGGFALTPNDNFSEGDHSSSRDGEEQVYFAMGDQKPMTSDCAVVKLPEEPTRVQVSVALAEASALALAGWVEIRWVPE